MKYMKLNFECAGCDKQFIIAFGEDQGDDLPEFCPFCGEGLIVPQAEDKGDDDD